ncbi:hypothetical protein C2G38_2101794 [Gigaspora rosea]|uniref:Tetratricopeptide repeat protein n=1 Tax=Gigaspora rosea TaxID=44941 RepID=A0A397UTQ2_9GLOM|nr:hypothetical protein C2G38_2101794 [Gigaspora rosea]
MKHLQTKNLLFAEEYLLTSSQICESNLLVLNELGVLYFQKLKYAQSVDSFKNALKYGKKYGLILAMRSGSLASWILLNHISKSSLYVATKALYIYHMKEEFEEAIMYYQEVLYQFYIIIS